MLRLNPVNVLRASRLGPRHTSASAIASLHCTLGCFCMPVCNTAPPLYERGKISAPLCLIPKSGFVFCFCFFFQERMRSQSALFPCSGKLQYHCMQIHFLYWQVSCWLYMHVCVHIYKNCISLYMCAHIGIWNVDFLSAFHLVISSTKCTHNTIRKTA